jgi:hypothetical protein
MPMDTGDTDATTDTPMPPTDDGTTDTGTVDDATSDDTGTDDAAAE